MDAVRSALEGWNRGDFDAWLGSAHPDIEFRTSGVYPGTDPIYRGPGELRRFWTTLHEPWESLQVHIDQVHDLGGDVVVLSTSEGDARDGMRVQREVGSIPRFVDGLNTRQRNYATWKEALEAAGLRE